MIQIQRLLFVCLSLQVALARTVLQKAPDATAKPTTTAVDATTKPTAAAATSTPAGAGPTCGTLDPSSTAPPGNAVLYLSVRGPGTITYKCVEANKPVVLEESAELNQSISKGWSGKVETKDGARIITTTNANEKPPATNVFVLGANPTSSTVLNGAPDLRWEVTSNTGASAAEGGIPSGTNYVTRTQAEGGAPPRSCDAGETIKVPFSAAYNIYSCDEAYLVQAPGPSVAVPATAPVPSVSVAPIPAPAPAPLNAMAPIAIPPVSVAPIPAPAPTPSVVVAAAPAPAPSAGVAVSAFFGGLAIVASMV